MGVENTDLHDAFLRHFATNEAALRAYIRCLVPTRDDAADVMQGVALVLWKKFEELDRLEHFRRWAFGVARYESLAWLRDKARDRRVLASDVLDSLASDSAKMDEKLEAQREVLEDCLKKLPQEQRKFVLRAYMPDVQIKDVAQQSGRTVGGFYQWLHRMRLRLLECVKKSEFTEGLS